VVTPKGPRLVSPDTLVEALAPKLSRDEEIYLQSSAQVFLGLLGIPTDPKKGLTTDISPRRVVEVVGALASQRDDEMRRAVSQLLSQRSGRGLITQWWSDMAIDLRDMWSKRLTEM